MSRLALKRALLAALVLLGWAAGAADGWTGAEPTRGWPSPVKPFWKADFSRGESAFAVERREGAEADVSFVRRGTNTVLRVSKTNARGTVVVRTKDPVAVPDGALLRTVANVEARTRDPEHALGFLRLYGGAVDLAYYSKLDGRSTGGPRMSQLVNTAPGASERKMAHFKAPDGAGIGAAIVVSGEPSISEWSEWYVEDTVAAEEAWQKVIAAKEPPDRSGDQVGADAFARALAADREHVARIERREGRSTLLVDSRPTAPILFKGQHAKTGEKNTFNGRDMQRAGITLQACTVRLGNAPRRKGYWTRDGFDVRGVVDELRAAMRSSDRSLFVVTFGLDAYPEFSAEHPDEIWRLEDGRPVFGHHGHALHPVPKTCPEGHWPWISMYSPAWRTAVKAHLAELIAELKASGLSKRIVGFHLAGFHDAQFAVRQPDYSAPAQAAFRHWCRARGLDEPDELPHYGREDDFVDPVRDSVKAAFIDFQKRGPFAVEEDIARHVKRCFGKDLIAVRWCMQRFGGTWNSSYDVLPFLRSDVFDVLVAQQSYPRRIPGLATGLVMPVESFHLHGKLFLDELDYQTYGALGRNDTELRLVASGWAHDFPMWESMHRKGVGQMLAHEMGFWYFDMNGGWFSPPEISSDIAGVVAFARDELLRRRAPWRPDAALVMDEDGMLLRNSPGIYYRRDETAAVVQQGHYLGSSGVPYDVLMLDDLCRDPALARRYRVLVFAGLYDIDASRGKMLETLRSDGRTLVYLANSGRIRGAAERLGFRLDVLANPSDHALVAARADGPAATGAMETEYRARYMGLPGSRTERVSVVEGPGVEALARYAADGAIAVASRRRATGRDVYVAEAGGLSPTLFNLLVREAGGFAATDRAGLQVDMRDGFASVHCTVPGKWTLRLPYRARTTNLKTGVVGEAADAIDFTLVAGETRWIAFGPADGKGSAAVPAAEISVGVDANGRFLPGGRTAVEVVWSVRQRIDEVLAAHTKGPIVLHGVGSEGAGEGVARAAAKFARMKRVVWDGPADYTNRVAKGLVGDPCTDELYSKRLGKDWWLVRLVERQRQIAASGGAFDLVMLGDSITHFWERKCTNSWESFTSEFRALNCGYAGDRVNNLLWRVENGELDGYTAKAVTILIGTNDNTKPDSDPAQVAAGIRRVLDVVRTKQPEARVLLCAIPPRGRSAGDARHCDARRRNERTNEIIRPLADGKKVRWLDFGAEFLDPKTGWVSKELMPDGIHPSEKGYALVRTAIENALR